MLENDREKLENCTLRMLRNVRIKAYLGTLEKTRKFTLWVLRNVKVRVKKERQFSKTNTDKSNILPKQKRMNSNISKTTQIQIVTCFQNKRIKVLVQMWIVVTPACSRKLKVATVSTKIIIINKFAYLVGNEMQIALFYQWYYQYC